MPRIFAALRRFARNQRGTVTVDWIAVTAAFLILGIGVVYAIFGDEDGGLIALVNGTQDQLATDSTNINTMLDEVNTWTPSTD